MASYYPCVKNHASGYIFYVGLISQASTKSLQGSATLAAGDVKVSIDGGALANLGTLPVVTPAASKSIKVTLSQAEINGDNIIVIFADATGAEWCDLLVNIRPCPGVLTTWPSLLPRAAAWSWTRRGWWMPTW